MIHKLIKLILTNLFGHSLINKYLLPNLIKGLHQ